MTKRTTELMALDSIKRATSNPKRHDVRAIMRSMALNGFGEAPMLDERTQRLIAGHGRLEALTALRLENKEPPKGVIEKGKDWLVPIQRGWASKNDAEAKAYIVASNRTTELGGWDDDELNAMLSELAKSGVDNLAAAGYDGAELDKMIRDSSDISEDEIPETPPNSWVKAGDLFQLGGHRILCGNSLNKNDVATVIGESKIAACITDPPYSVNYDRSVDERGGSHVAHDGYREADIKPSDLLGFLEFVPCDVLVWSYPIDRHFFAVADSMKKYGFEFRKELVWVKDQFSFWMGAQYQQKHEPILVCSKKGKPLNSHVPANQTTVFEIPRPKKHAIHPTQKPIELWKMLVSFHSSLGDTLYEPFSGSGTTIMACEESGRNAVAIELEPKFVQVAIERWEKFTGKKHVKL